MRIVHILRGKASPDTINGVNKVVHWMATYQARQGHKVEVWGLSASMTPPPHEREYNLRIFPMTRLRMTLGRELKAAMASLEPGTWVQFHSVFILEFPAISRQLRKRGFAYGVTPHGAYSPEVFKKNPWKKHIYFALREAKYLRGASLIQAIGETEIQNIQRIAPGVRVVLIPNAQESLPARTGAAPVNAERPLIGYCGRLATQQKGLDYLIEGFGTYKAKGGAGELWLIGDGEDRVQLERQATKSGAQTHIRFLGVKMGEERLDLIAGCDAFIHSSRWDVLPTSCLEAAALGKPLVVSRETNMAEYIERSEAGLVLDETSAAGVMRALERVQVLYGTNQLDQMGEKARLLMKKEFSWEEHASKFIAAAEEQIKSQSRIYH